MASESPSSLPFPSLTELADDLSATEPTEQVNEDVLCDIEDPLLFQAVLTRFHSLMDWGEWNVTANKLALLSPRSLIVALAAREFRLDNLNAKRLRWMLRGPNPYVLNRPTMMHEVRVLNLVTMQTFPSLHHFTSLRKLQWRSDLSLSNDAFSLLRNVTGLQGLDVNMRPITAPMFNDIAHMTNLVSLKLVADNYDAVPPLGYLQGLKQLAIWDNGRRQRNASLVLPSTLQGLTRIETLELCVQISEDLVLALPAMFPFLYYLRVYRGVLSQNALASLLSHYGNKEGFKLEFIP